MIYWRRAYVHVKIFQHGNFVSMCLANFNHIPQYESAITKGLLLVIYGESWKKVLSNFKCNLDATPPSLRGQSLHGEFHLRRTSHRDY